MIYLTKLIFFVFFTYSVNANEEVNNRILFKINDKVFTNIDLEYRIKYFKVINNVEISDINTFSNSEILDDYIAAVLFFEYNEKYNFINTNFDNELNQFYTSRFESSIKNINSKEEQNIKANIKIDLIRKKILENILNSKKEILVKKPQILDLIYNYNINYLIIPEEDIKDYDLKNIKNRKDFLDLKEYLENNKINFLFKNEDINDNSIISTKIKSQIDNDIKITYDNDQSYIKLISIEKDLASFQGIFVKLVNIKTNSKIDNNKLNCEYLKNQKEKIIFKEYEYSQLNKQIQNNLKSINDYILINDEDNYSYIFLCELRYDEKILNDLNFNKKINVLVNDIQSNFMNKYKNELNLEIFYE